MRTLSDQGGDHLSQSSGDLIESGSLSSALKAHGYACPLDTKVLPRFLLQGL